MTSAGMWSDFWSDTTDQQRPLRTGQVRESAARARDLPLCAIYPSYL
jgi:hypothetical protein